VLNAVELANQVGARTIGFTGYDGGKLGRMVEVNLNVASNMIEQVEDIHLILQHLICKALREFVRTGLIAQEPVVISSIDTISATSVEKG
jgi:D-sedoheptulose 7-phosphate isomerase